MATETSRENRSMGGQRVVVIGASSGIGRSVSRMAVEAGAEVVMVSRSLDRLRAASEELVPRPSLYAVDALDAAAVDALFAEIGPFDHLVVTAVADETSLMSPLAEMTQPTAVRSMEKFWSTLHTARAAARTIRRTGSMTFTTSAAIFNPPRAGGASVMNAASGAVAVLGRSLAAELAPIRVNVVAPGVVDSGVWNEDEKQRLRTWGQTLPVGHLGQPDELADAYMFLMRATYVTGVVLPVDGGLAFT